MSKYNIQIGTSSGTLKHMDEVYSTLVDPRTYPIDYSAFVELGSGVKLGQGWLRQIWHWDTLTEDERNALYAYVGNVYIVTLKNDGTLGTYTALMTWPEKEPEHFANGVMDVNIEMRQMVAV